MDSKNPTSEVLKNVKGQQYQGLQRQRWKVVWRERAAKVSWPKKDIYRVLR